MDPPTGPRLDRERMEKTLRSMSDDGFSRAEIAHGLRGLGKHWYQTEGHTNRWWDLWHYVNYLHRYVD